MEIEFTNDTNKNYMVLRLEKRNDFAEKMFLENQYAGLLSAQLRSMDGEEVLYYDITGKYSLEMLYREKEIPAIVFTQLLSDLSAVLEEIRACVLPEGGLLLQKDTVFRDSGSKHFFFAFHPEGEGELDLSTLAEYLIAKVEQGDDVFAQKAYEFCMDALDGNCALAKYAEVFTQEKGIEEDCGERKETDALFLRQDREAEGLVCEENSRDADEDIHSLAEVEVEKTQEERTGDMLRSGFVIGGVLLVCCISAVLLFVLGIKQPVIGCVLVSECLSVIFLLIMRRRRGTEDNTTCADETEQLLEWTPPPAKQAYEETTYIPLEHTPENILYGVGPWHTQRIDLNQLPVVVGKNAEYADLILQDESISKCHAGFFMDKGNLIMKDMNSKNGTYLNGRRLNPSQEVVLEAEDEIKLGRVKFLLR